MFKISLDFNSIGLLAISIPIRGWHTSQFCFGASSGMKWSKSSDNPAVLKRICDEVDSAG